MIEIYSRPMGKEKVLIHVQHDGTLCGAVTLPKGEWEQLEKALDKSIDKSLLKAAIKLLKVRVEEGGYCPECKLPLEEGHLAECIQAPVFNARKSIYKALNRLQQTIIQVRHEEQLLEQAKSELIGETIDERDLLSFPQLEELP